MATDTFTGGIRPVTPSNNPSTATPAWNRALSLYRRLREACDALPIEDPAGDAAVDAYCAAMDHLIEDVHAPDPEAVKIKLELALERSSGFEALFPDHQEAIFADIARLGKTS